MSDTRQDTTAEQVVVGMKVFFPNSRGAQAVEQIEESGDIVTLVSGTARWSVSKDQEIAALLPEPIEHDAQEEGSDDGD